MFELRLINFCFSRTTIPCRRLSSSLTTLAKTNAAKNDENISFCVVGNGSDGNARSLFLNYNEKIFMFNCGEGVQRSISDLGYKASKIDTFFSTSSNWYNYSGLSSLLLSRYDSGSRYFNVNNIKNFSKNLFNNCIIFDTKLKRMKYDYFDRNLFVFEDLSIEIIPIIGRNNNNDKQTAIYLGTLKAKKGAVNLEKCFNKKVPRNLVDQLKDNFSVKNKDGQIIEPKDVCDPDKPEQNFLIFECIDKNYLENLIRNDFVRNFIKKCEIIVHFTRDKYLQQKSYDQFFQNFKSCYHLLITERNPPFNIRSNHRFQIQLNLLDPVIFPLLHRTASSIDSDYTNTKIIHSPTGIKYTFRSSEQLSMINFEDIPSYPSIDDALKYKNGEEREGIVESIEKLRAKQSSELKHDEDNSKNNYPQFVFLGTASSHSLPIRNVSSIMVNIDHRNSILMDCGENTYGQFLNLYGEKNLKEILSKIKVIFITHHHSDHHMGLIKLLEQRKMLCGDNRNNRLWLLLPPMVFKFFKNNSNIINISDGSYNCVQNQLFKQYRTKIIRTLNLQDLNLIPVDHCAFAYGISITDSNGYKFVYSGDTQPCNDLVEYGQNCDLLIHESTVEDGLRKFARTNFHSTMSEAINVGRRMNSKFIILTHFSQRYGKLPLLPESATGEQQQRIALAFDNMIVDKNQLKRLPLLYDTLKCMYAKHLERINYRSDIYQRKLNK